MVAKIFFGVVIIFIITKSINAHSIPTPNCGVNEVYTDCGTACPRSCGDNDTLACTAQCVPGCFCKYGYIRHGSKCITEEQCKNLCPRNEQYKTCGSACPPICGEKQEACNKMCVQGCFCKNGYIRKHKNDICIPEKECPTVCGRYEEYKECGTACPEICGYPKPTVCTKQCVQGCFCKPGYIKRGSKCILQKACDNICDKNEIYIDCRGCPDECDKRNIAGCFCKPGFVKCYNSTCIPECDCKY